jgi:formamidopyrimidine-DNA glycosylase
MGKIMPELPEVETIVRRLKKVLLDNTISKVDILRNKSFQGDPDTIIGKKIVEISRKAKISIIQFENGMSMIIHLKMTGQLIFQSDDGQRLGGGHPSDDWVNALPTSHTRVILKLSNGTLFFNDMRVFGWIKILKSDEVMSAFGGYAPDIIDSAVSPDYFKQVFRKKSQAIKQVLMDNAVVAGVGNIYANDALHMAKLSPFRPANSLTNEELQRLYDSVIFVINKGIELGGATIDNYRTVDGLAGGYQDIVRVYLREGQPCLVCSSAILRTKQGGRSTFYCAVCQT